MSTGQATPTLQPPALARVLGTREAIAITLNTTIGAGIFGLPSALAAAAGPASLLVLGAAFLLVAGIALCTAEVASRFDAAGGPVTYVHAALGPLGGFSTGWLLFTTRVATFGAVAVVMLDYAAGLLPVLAQPMPRALALCGFVILITVLNLRGARAGAGIGNLLLVAKLVPLLLLAPAGLWLMGWPEPLPGPAPPIGTLGSALLLAFFACMGFENATVMAGELRNPQRQLPLGMLGGLLLVGLLYAAVMLACQAGVPDLAQSRRPLADLAQALAGPAGATLIAITAICSCAGNLGTSILVSPRVLFAMAEQRDLPAALARVSEGSRVPTLAIVLTSALVCVLTVTGTFVHLATIAAISRMLIYAAICVSLPVLRRSGPARLIVPGGPALAVLSLLACLAVLATANLQALQTVALVLLAGYLVRAAYRSRTRAATQYPTEPIE